MNVHRLAASVDRSGTGQVNLFFEVLAKRNDGFHEIETLMVPDRFVRHACRLAANPTARCASTCRWAARTARKSTLGQLPPEARKSGHPRRRACCAAARASAHGVWPSTWSSAFRRPPGWAAVRATPPPRCWPPTSLWNLGWPRGSLARDRRRIGQRRSRFSSVAARPICRGRGERIEPSPAPGASALRRGAAAARACPRPRSMPTAACRATPRPIDPLDRGLARRRHRGHWRIRFTIAWRRPPSRCRPGSAGCERSSPARIAWRRG